MEERLQKIMAQAGVGSRRHNEQLIRAGRVRVNGRIAQLGDKADPDVDKIEIDNTPLSRPSATYIYIALYKPHNVLTTLHEDFTRNRTTIRDLVNLSTHVYPVGRLDRDSEGLLLLTNDGELTYRLTHPRFGHQKVYRVLVTGRPTAPALQQWRQGVLLDDRPTAPAEVEVLEHQPNTTWLRVVMREGRKRQIRRVAEQLGHSVQRLIREQIGPLSLGNLQPGQWRHLTTAEIAALRRSAGLEQHKSQNEQS